MASKTASVTEFPKLLDISDTSTSDKQDVVINSEKFTIGRALRNSHVLKDISISRYHCVIELINGTWMVEDMSFNGTLINDSLISKEKTALKDGDILKLSETLKFKFVLPTDNVIDLTNEPNAAAVAPVQTVKQEATCDSQEEDLTCSICAELFYKAVTLGCSHTFCEYCINECKRVNPLCPICRAKIQTQCPSLIINNFVKNVLSKADEEAKKHREEIIQSREKGENSSKDKALASKAAALVSNFFGSDEDTSDDENEDEMDFDFSDDEYNGLPGAYYGGYGSCFSCGDHRHWANGCPWVPH